MGCPHSLIGDAATCSQCRGAAPRVVTRDDATGQMMIDGRPVDRMWQPPGYGRNGPPPRNRGRPSKAVVELRRREAADDPGDLE